MPEPTYLDTLIAVKLNGRKGKRTPRYPFFDSILAAAFEDVAYNLETRSVERPIRHGGKRAARHS